MNKNYKDLLDEKISREVISKRDGGGGRKLDYLEGWYVIDRLNQVFGHLGWSKEIIDVKLLDSPKPSYLVKVRLTVKVEGETKITEGYGYGSDKSALNPHELAIKEAVTDALKVAAKDLGMSMGLALYDKSQEFVDEGKEEVKEKPKAVAMSTPKQTSSSTIKEPKVETKTSPDSKETKLKLITNTAIAITHARKEITKERLLVYFDKSYSIKDTSVTDCIGKLTEEQHDVVLKHFEGVLNGKDL